MEAAIAAAINGSGGAGTVADMMGNPAIMQALQAHLGGLAGVSSGLLEELPPAVRRRIKALKQLANENAKLDSEMKKEMLKIEAAFAVKRKPLFDKRASIISGGYEPTDEECVWEDDEDDEDEDEEGGGDADGDGAGGDADGEEFKGVPNFWLTVFQNCPPLAETIEDQDIPILEALEDVKCDTDLAGNYTITFTFAENEFFTGTVLTKKYNVNLDETEKDVVYDGPQYEQAEGCEVQWKAGQNPTVKITKKKQRKKTGNGKGQVRTITKTEEQPSFFNLFSPPTMPGPDPDDLSEELQEALFRDFEIGDMFKEKVTPHAVLWYTGEANDHQGLGDMDDDDMYGSEGEDGEMAAMMGGPEDDDSEDPDYAPPPEGEQPAECKNQ